MLCTNTLLRQLLKKTAVTAAQAGPWPESRAGTWDLEAPVDATGANKQKQSCAVGHVCCFGLLLALPLTVVPQCLLGKGALPPPPPPPEFES